jgi:uncharacterized SAM-binding protein YcdF (DUF218 family)
MVMQPKPQSKFGGLFTRRERWGISWRGWAVVVAGLAIAAYGFVRSVHPFFAITERVDTRLLAVEGWVNPFAIRAAAKEVRSHTYERVFSTGGPMRGTGAYTNDFNTVAGVGADRLKSEGVPASLVHVVASRVMARDRTYSSAVALREWCQANQISLSSINVLTEDIHARRTRLLYQKALGDNVRIGIIAVSNPDYDARYWWRYSEGVRAVVGECFAYVYAKCFFWP